MKKHHIPHWHRGLHAIHFGFLGGLVAVTFIGTLLMYVLSPIWLKHANASTSSFASNSFWNTTIPAYTQLHPSSAALVSDVVRQVNQYGSSLNKGDGAGPIYTAEPGTPTVSVDPWDCGGGIPGGLASQWQAVPIPFYAQPSGGANPKMVIYQPSAGTSWEFGHMRKVGNQWQACTGGQISTSSTGVFASPYGVSSSGLATLGGQVSVAELQSGQINHAIGLTLVQAEQAGIISYPATQSDGYTPGSPPMGLRFRLDPNVNVDSLGLSSVGRAIAKAAQTYGFVVWDTTSSVGVVGENPLSFTLRGLSDPYGGILGGSSPLSGFPWDKLQALPHSYGSSSSIPVITQFSASQTSIQADNRVTLSWQASNVDRCSIASLGSNLAASGSIQTPPLHNGTIFTLRCGGPAGTTSSQVSIQVSPITGNDPQAVIGSPTTIDAPYSGYANIFPDLMSGLATEKVYKVVYYEEEVYLFETATPPFALNTSRMENGKHDITARIYYRDGGTDQRVLGISVNNSPETLQTTPAAVQAAPPSIPLLWGILGGLFAVSIMSAGTWWGWHRAHLI